MRASARDFKEAWEAKDIDALIGLLDPDAMAIGDGGGLVSAEPLLASGSHFGRPLAHGMSTRKVDDLVRALGGDSGISKSEVSRICVDLDAEVGTFRDPQQY
jgi:Transposase, Mutator family